MADSGVQWVRWLAEEWSARLGQILESMTDQRPRVEWRAGGDPSAAEAMFWQQTLAGVPSVSIWVGAPEAACIDLGTRTLRAAGIDTVESADARNTYLEILNQALGGLAQALTSRLDREITCETGAECAQPPEAVEWATVEIAYQDGTLPAILLGMEPASIEQLDQAAHAGEAETPSHAPAESQAAQELHTAVVPQGSRTLDLLLDVELPVSISFGRAELPLKDVLKLATGSIVELNRGISEPVEVIVNNCVVARGEVVVMDGNYGVRIHQIISPQERLRTLK